MVPGDFQCVSKSVYDLLVVHKVEMAYRHIIFYIGIHILVLNHKY